METQLKQILSGSKMMLDLKLIEIIQIILISKMVFNYNVEEMMEQPMHIQRNL